MKKKKYKKINFKKKIYYLYGDNLIKKNKYKIFIKKQIKKKYKKITTINIVVNKNINWKDIYEKIFFKDFFFQVKIITINFIEEIKNINKLIINNIINKNFIKKNKKIFIIFNIEYINFLSLIEINKFKKYYFIKIIKCTNNNIEKKYNNKIIEDKYKNNKILKLWIKSIKKKNIFKNTYILKKIKKKKINKIIILNILFKFIKKNINNFNKKNLIYILKLIQKYDFNIKKNINISWINFNIISWYIIKTINLS